MRITVLTILALLSALPVAGRQEVKTDASFHNMPIRRVIDSMAEGTGKSVAFDVEAPTKGVTFEIENVTRMEAIAALLEREHLASVEVGDVLVVVPDREALLGRYYSPERVASLLVADDNQKRTTVVFSNTSLSQLLEGLARSIGRKASFDAAITNDTRRYNLKLDAATRAEALRIAMLVSHVTFREEGNTIVFEAAVQ